MPSRNVLLVAGVIAVIALFLTLKRKPPVGPERAAAMIVSKGVEAIEAGDIDEVMDLVAEDFSGQVRGLGELSRGDLKRYLVSASLMGGLSVTIATQDIEVGEDNRSATITIRAVLVAGGIRGALESNADAREIVVNIELRDDEWLVVSVS
jgi:hypothetical protein